MHPTCESFREALSARLDGQDAPLRLDAVRAHLVGCAECRAYEDGALRIDLAVAAARAKPVRDGTPDVLAAAAAGRDREQSDARLRGLLGLAALAQLVLAVTTVTGLAGVHLAADLAVYELAAAGGLAAVAWRPSLAAGLLPTVALAAVAGLVVAVLGVVGGTGLAPELPHLVLAVAVWPLVVLAGQQPRADGLPARWGVGGG